MLVVAKTCHFKPLLEHERMHRLNTIIKLKSSLKLIKQYVVAALFR